MDSKQQRSICDDIYKRFPEVTGIQPKVKLFENGSYLFIFQGKAQTGNGMSIPRTVRVVVDQNGKINKVTTSR